VLRRSKRINGKVELIQIHVVNTQSPIPSAEDN